MIQPRWFWRRLFALIIDYVIAASLAVALLVPFLDPGKTPLRLSDGPVHFHKCYQVNRLPQRFHDLIAPETIDEAKLCEHWTNGIANGRTVQMIYARTETRSGARTTRSHRSLTVAVDENDNITTTFSPQDALTYLFMILLAVFCYRWFQGSPGKRIMGLRLAGDGCIVCRELRRIGPLLVISIINLALIFVPAEAGASFLAGLPFAALIVSALLMVSLVVWYYLWPFFKWTGQARWDRATGFELVRR